MCIDAVQHPHGLHPGNNEIDQPLIELLEQNIEGASMAKNEDAVKFLTKVRDAARKFVLN